MIGFWCKCGQRGYAEAKHCFGLPVTEADEMLAPEQPLAASGRLIEWRSERKP
jgi:hypothetical protein